MIGKVKITMANKKASLNYIGIGERIRQRRDEKRFTQKDLALEAGISPNHISNIEKGSYGLSLETLVAICDKLDVSPDYLLLGNTHTYDVPADIVQNLRLCSSEDIELIQQQVRFMMERNKKKNAEEKYIDRTSAYNKKKK